MKIAPARYELLRVLGRGSSFAVALCRLEQTPVIVKRDTTSSGAIDREGWALAKLRGAHAPALVEAGRDEAGPFVAEAVAAGLPLRAWLARYGADRASVLGAASSLLDAIQAVHAGGVIHADIAPANAWLDGPLGEVTLIDFGASGDAAGATPAPVGRGTLPWIPPELARDEARPSSSTDRYGIAALVAYLFTGEPLTTATTEASQLYSIGASGLDSEQLRRALAASRIGEVPEGLIESLLAVLAFDPRRRPRSLDELREAVSSFRARTATTPS